MILAPRTPRSRPSSSALVVDSASASAHTTRLAARDTTGARSAGRVHAGPESAASWLTASASMLDRPAVHAMRPPITSSNYGGNNQVTCALQANDIKWLVCPNYYMYDVHPRSTQLTRSIRGLVSWAHSSQCQAPPSAPRFKVGRAAPRTVGGSECGLERYGSAHLSMLPTVPL